jgi:hypothetical protein
MFARGNQQVIDPSHLHRGGYRQLLPLLRQHRRRFQEVKRQMFHHLSRRQELSALDQPYQDRMQVLLQLAR